MAHKTYKSKKSDPLFSKITVNIIAKLKNITSPVKRAMFCQKEVQKTLHILMNDPIIKDNISCSQGCSYCCHGQVSVTHDEATLLIQEGFESLKKKEVLTLLNIQKNAKNSSKEWFKIPYSLRRCIFLDEQNLCSIYKFRPLVCRTNYILGNPWQCSTIDGIEKPLRSLNTFRADMITMGAFLHSRQNGSLPYMLYNVLNPHERNILSSKYTSEKFAL